MHSPSIAINVTQRSLRGATWGTRAQFFNLGFCAGVWGVHVPSVKTQYALNEALLSVVLLAAGIGAVLSLLFAGRVVGLLGARAASAVAGCAMCAALASVLVLPHFATLLLAMLVFGAGGSLMDVAINAEGTTLETMSGTAVMSGFHGMFSLGGMSGAAVAAALLRMQIAPWLQLLGAGLVIASAVLLAARWMLPVHPVEEGPRAHFVWPHGVLLLIGVLACAGMIAEGVMYDWSVLYMKQELGTPQEQAALAYASFSAAMAATRFGGDWLRARVSERRLLVGGATMAALAMALVLWLGHWVVALAGFVVVGVGLAAVVPILYTASTRVPGASRAAAIASVSAIGYAGFMVGPPLIGGIAHATSLTHAMGVVAVAAALLAVGSRRIPQ